MSVITADMNQNPVANSQMNRVEDATSEYLCEDCAETMIQRGRRIATFYHMRSFQLPLENAFSICKSRNAMKTKHDIRDVVFQDPSFRPVEIQFLDSLGYTVLDDPDAFDMMSPSTFLFAPYCPDIVTYKALKSSFPALYIGNDPRSVISSIMCRRSGLERMRARRQVDTFLRFVICTKQGESMMPVFDGEVWVADAQVRWLSPEYKKFERGVSLVSFFLFELFVFLLMAWKKVKNRFVTE
ncbi:MAG: hypothetical protein Q9175_005047 [Cornicularia normoerica]